MPPIRPAPLALVLIIGCAAPEPLQSDPLAARYAVPLQDGPDAMIRTLEMIRSDVERRYHDWRYVGNWTGQVREDLLILDYIRPPAEADRHLGTGPEGIGGHQ